MKKARGKAAAKHQAAKVAAKVAANSVEKVVVVAENTPAETVELSENVITETTKEINITEKNETVKKEVKTEVMVQFRHYEADMDEIIRRVKENFEVKGNRGVEIEKIQVYVKPEDFTAYYVINDGFAGKVNLF